MKRSRSIALAGSCLLLALGAFSQSQQKPSIQTPPVAPRTASVPKPVPFRSADGRISGWKISIPGNRPLASPAIAEGKLFVGGGFGSHEFYAFDANTGDHLWTYHTADDGPTAAAVEDGRIAFNTESCELEVITTDGKPLWKKWLGDPLMSMPAIAGGMVYMAYPDSKADHKYYLAAFDIKTGRQAWKAPLANEVITAPVIDADRVYTATIDGSMLAVNRTDGRVMWQETRNATSAPAVWKDQVYFSRGEEQKTQSGGKPAIQKTELLAARLIGAPASAPVDMIETRQKADYLDYTKNERSSMLTKQVQMDASVGFATSKGAALMAPAQRNLGKATVNGIWAHQGSKPFVDQGRLYSSMGDNARSVDPATGKVIWSRKLRAGRSESDLDALLTPPAIVNGKLFIASASGEVYALAEKSGDVLWTVKIGEPVSFQPTVANGHVYVATDGGTLYCLNTGDARDHGWLMWGANGAHNGMAGK